MHHYSNLLSLLAFLLLVPSAFGQDQAADRPNILWITAEDHGPHLGAYGDPYAQTPNIDALAEQSYLYEVAWSDAPVCAPARTSIITGVYPTSTGGQHMRSDVELPDFMQMYPVLLRRAGYYATNNSKEDYNVSGDEPVWDESSEDAHYKNRGEDQPFFAVFNFTESHESRIRERTKLPHHDPAVAPLPPYHPDTPEVRRDWAQYYHGISNVDQGVGEILDELSKAGLADDTIIFFYADHGSGMPRSKRWPYNSGLHVPLMVHVPEKYAHLAPEGYELGGRTRRPIAFVDLAPTLLSIVNIEQPEWMQGRPFMGHSEAEPREYLFGFRGRMDERYDMVRSVRNDRYVYVRNYMPRLIYGQYLSYMFITETTQVWHDMYHNEELVPPETHFWEAKPTEELYDLKTDPHEVRNLVDCSEHEEVLEELREAHRKHVMETRDAGFLTEAEMHRRAGDTSIYEMAQDDDRYPLERIFEMANVATNRDSESMSVLRDGFDDDDPAVRYWAAQGILIRGAEAFEIAADDVRSALTDINPSVRITAAETLIEHGTDEEKYMAIDTLLELAPPDETSAFVGIAALNILANLDEDDLKKIRPTVAEMEVEDPDLPDRPNDYVHRLVTDIVEGGK